MIEMPLGLWSLLFAVAGMSGIGLGLFLGLLLIRRSGVSYHGQVIMHTVSDGPMRQGPDAPAEVPKSLLTVTLKNRFDGMATLRFEGDCPARDALHDSEVGDRWRVELHRERKIKRKEKRYLSFKPEIVSRQAFGGKDGRAF